MVVTAMATLCLYVLLTFLTVAVLQSQSRDARGSTGTSTLLTDDVNITTGECSSWISTSKHIPGLKCESGKATLLLGYCAIYQEDSNYAAVGRCPFLHTSQSKNNPLGHLLITLPGNVSELNENQCGSWHRTGLLCSQCKPGLGPIVIPDTSQCGKCLPKHYGWILFLIVVSVPSTLFFVLLLLFQVRATSAPLNFYIFISHLVATYLGNARPDLSTEAKLLATTYGVWNFEFFYPFLPRFCISEHMSLIHVTALGYFAAFLPLFLICLTYTFIELHARDCQLVVCILKPFSICLTRIRRMWDPRGSFIHTFAIFLLLSYTKLTVVSCALLGRTIIYTVSEGHANEHGAIYLDASKEYFNIDHLPFALLAIVVLCTMVFPPILFLCLYPLRGFQRCMYKCRLQWHGLNAFAEAFNGCYKDGTKDTPDYRYFGGFYLLLRIAVVTSLSADVYYIWLLLIVIFSTQSLLFTILRPYKDNFFNITDGLFGAVSAFVLLLNLFEGFVSSIPDAIYWILAAPFVYFVLHIASKALLRTILLECRSRSSRCQRFRVLMERLAGYHSSSGYEPHSTSNTTAVGDDNSLPHRLTSPGHYRHYGSVSQ